MANRSHGPGLAFMPQLRQPIEATQDCRLTLEVGQPLFNRSHGLPEPEFLIAGGYIPEIFLCDPGNFRGTPRPILAP
jgi:hypothetical protein